jgi:type II secretion system protein C
VKPNALGPRLAELAAVVLLAFALAKIVGAWFWPLPVAEAPAGAVAPQSATPVAIQNPFGAPLASAGPANASDDAVVEAVNTDLNLTLFGTWVDGDAGTATISQADGVQKVYRIGDEICCGARLDKVFATHVLINRGGAIEALRLPNKFEQPSDATGESIAPAAASVTAGPGLAEIVSLQPTLSSEGVLEFALTPAGDPELFAALGLQENDVIVSVNGRSAPPTADKIPAFFASLRGDKTFKIIVRRSGQAVAIDIALPLAVRGQEG